MSILLLVVWWHYLEAGIFVFILLLQWSVIFNHLRFGDMSPKRGGGWVCGGGRWIRFELCLCIPVFRFSLQILFQEKLQEWLLRVKKQLQDEIQSSKKVDINSCMLSLLYFLISELCDIFLSSGLNFYCPTIHRQSSALQT